jgi:hypothetical protein
MKHSFAAIFLFILALNLSGSTLPNPWWKTMNGTIRYQVKAENLTLNKLQTKLDSLYKVGYRVIEIFAPSQGGDLYHGLAVMDFYTIDPAIGTKNDLHNLVNACHDKGMAITVFTNPGYCDDDAPFFKKACNDVKNNIESKERNWFLWSDNDSAKLENGNNYFTQKGKWVFNKTAGKYFFSKWKDQPQFNFGHKDWQDECRRVMEFYMSFGFDGIIVDAPNFYLNCNWDIIRYAITDVVNALPNKFSQPEGAGAFGDDPEPWITKGGFNCVQNYGLGIWWDHIPIVAASVEMGSPYVLETRLNEFRDKIDALGGVCYFYPFWDKPLWTARRLVEIAFLASSGHLFTFAGGTGGYTGSEVSEKWKPEERAQYAAILNQVNANPALGPSGQRIQLQTPDNTRFYSYLRISADKKHKVLVVLDFGHPREISISTNIKELKGAKRIRNLGDKADVHPIENKQVKVHLPWLGWGFYEVEY